jgi:hypothetical protein
MSMTEFETALREQFDTVIALLLRKRRSYGTRNLTRFGGFGIAVRMGDKGDRLATMYQSDKTGSPDGDSMLDAYRDTLGYAVLGILYELGPSGRLADWDPESPF